MDTSVRCPRCWKHIPASVRFCPRCGSALSGTVATKAIPPRSRSTPPGGGSGVTALLIFLVIGAFGLMVMLFVGSHSAVPVVFPPAPVQVQPGYPATPPSDDIVTEQDRRQVPDYTLRWDESGHYRVAPPPMYPVRPRIVVPYPPSPESSRDRTGTNSR